MSQVLKPDNLLYFAVKLKCTQNSQISVYVTSI